MRKTLQEEKSDEIDSAKPKHNTRSNNSKYRPQGAKDALNKFEAKDNKKDVTNQLAPSPVSYHSCIKIIIVYITGANAVCNLSNDFTGRCAVH